MGMRGSESLHYTPRVTFQEPAVGRGTRGCGTGTMTTASPEGASSPCNASAGVAIVRGSLPDLRSDVCVCGASYRRGSIQRSSCGHYGDSSGSTDSILDEADDLMRSTSSAFIASDADYLHDEVAAGATKAAGYRRFSENDIKRGMRKDFTSMENGKKTLRITTHHTDYSPSKQSLPFLPKSPKCLKLGHLVKVITRTGRVVVGRVRYIGPLAGEEFAEDDTFVGLQLPSKVGDCDGSIGGRRFFEWYAMCDALHEMCAVYGFSNIIYIMLALQCTANGNFCALQEDHHGMDGLKLTQTPHKYIPLFQYTCTLYVLNMMHPKANQYIIHLW